jgi:Protein of unknown function (DUF3237)
VGDRAPPSAPGLIRRSTSAKPCLGRPVAAANQPPKLRSDRGGPRHRADAKGSVDRRRSPERHGPADCAFCACACAQNCAAIALVGGQTNGSLIEPATLTRQRFGDRVRAAEQATPLASKRQASDGSALWWGDADTPAPPQIVAPGMGAAILTAVSPMRPGHSVAVEYRVNGGPIHEAIGVLEPRIHDAKARKFRAIVPGQSNGLVEFLPVLRFAGQPISTRLSETAECPRYQVGSGTPVETSNLGPGTSPSLAEYRWPWDARFLGACTIQLRKEVVGAVSDGLRINWRFEEARFVGPVLEGAFLPGAADWMRIRPDGVGIVQVLGCIETRTGARVYTSYGGIVDLGRDGYARALRGESDPLPSFVGAPTFATADKELEWLNRAQCLVVGRVDMRALRVEYDAYAIEVGATKQPITRQRDVGARSS